MRMFVHENWQLVDSVRFAAFRDTERRFRTVKRRGTAERINNFLLVRKGNESDMTRECIRRPRKCEVGREKASGPWHMRRVTLK